MFPAASQRPDSFAAGAATQRLDRLGAGRDALADWLRRSALALPLAALAALAALLVVVVNETRHEQSVHALARLEQRAGASAHVQTVLRRMLDAETALRGYLLTGRPSYLQPYTRAGADIDTHLRALRLHFADDGTSMVLLNMLGEQTDTRLAQLAQTLARLETGEPVAWPEPQDAGRQNLLRLRSVAQQLVVREREQMAQERQAVFDTLRSSRIGVSATAGVGMLALLMLLLQTAALDAAQRRHAQTLQAEYERLEAEVRQRTDDLSELARHLQTVREDERSRLARDLRDELGALLTTAKLDVVRLRRSLGAAAPDTLARLQHLTDSLDSGIALKRRIVDDLRPASLSNLGLVAALQILAREFAERAGVAVATDLQPLVLSDAVQITVFRLVQEALTNIAKYARAQQVHLGLRADRGTAHLRVVDDGQGFDPALQPKGAHGLIGMRYRVEGAGGRLTIESAPGQGTRIEAELPLQRDGSPALETGRR